MLPRAVPHALKGAKKATAFRAQTSPLRRRHRSRTSRLRTLDQVESTDGAMYEGQQRVGGENESMVRRSFAALQINPNGL